MTGASKILTVSYGTFSCTLEGFDDPFNTMKAIAEYFRDLAAGDRYFGAEPPTPDAAMLHRIAEREIHRRVEAKIQDNGVILRAGDAADPVAPEPAPPALLDAESTVDSVAVRLQRIRARHIAASAADQADAGVQDDAAHADAAAQDAPLAETASALSVAGLEDLGLQDVVLEDVALADVMLEDVALVEAETDDAYIEDQHAEDLPLPQTGLAPIDADLIESSDQIPDQIEDILDEAENDLAMAEAGFDPADIADLVTAQADMPDATVIEDADQDDDLDADETMLANLADDLAFDPSDAQPENAPEAASEIGSEIDSGTIEDDLPEIWQGESDDDALLSRLAGDAAASEVEPAIDEDEDEDQEEYDELNLDLFDPEADMPAPEQIEDVDQVVQEATTETAEIAPQDDEDAAPQPAPRARARVIRIRRADPPAAPQPALAAEASPATALSDEAEAALQAELAALEAEIGGLEQDAPEAPLTAEATPEMAAAPAPVAPKQITAPAEDDAVNRLMEHAKSEMDGTETRRRQSAIAHLKAAVAATEADHTIGGDKAVRTESRMDAYRNDLDRVVRPRRPVAEVTTPRPAAPAEAAARPTPLVLVSAQRIDRAKPATTPTADTAPRVVMPVRPRRVSQAAAAISPETAAQDLPTPRETAAPVMQDFDQRSAQDQEFDEDDALILGESDNVFGDATSFQDFADQLGASALPDLLEAAAVYCAEVLQRPEFSRPLVMRQIAALPGQSDTAREDYLRGFGTLLRQGRIAKVKRGMFALTDRSPYLAEARKQAS